MKELILKSADHPQANGRNPLNGEVGYAAIVPLEDGRILRLLRIMLMNYIRAPSGDYSTVPLPDLLKYAAEE